MCAVATKAVCLDNSQCVGLQFAGKLDAPVLVANPLVDLLISEQLGAFDWSEIKTSSACLQRVNMMTEGCGNWYDNCHIG